MPAFAALVMMAAVLGGAGTVYAAPVAPFSSFRDIPGVTAEETLAIEALQKKHESLAYGMTLTSEAFLDENGQVNGFAALVCEWLTGLFGIRFQPEVYAWNDLIRELNAAELDFAGTLIMSDERKRIYHMTNTIAERQYKIMRLKGSPPLDKITETRLPRYAFLANAVHSEYVAAVTEPGSYESVWVNDYAEVHQVLTRGEADAFIAIGVAEVALIAYDDMDFEDFLPLIYNPVAISTAKAELAPIISVIDKALASGADAYLAQLYSQGYRDYMRYKMFVMLSDEERAYIAEHPVVPVVANYDNYPVCFYDSREGEWQGIFFDLLEEITAITGLSFNLINRNNDDWPVIYEMVKSGEASLIADLTWTLERARHFVWPESGPLPDYLALVSKAGYRDIMISEIKNAKVGVARGTVYASNFRQWFPDHPNTIEYENMNMAIAALGRDEVDLVMSSQRRLMFVTHYLELPDYKTNIFFNQPLKTLFGVNRGEAVLCSIIDKALQVVNTAGISDNWTRRTYDYRAKVAKARLPWLLGATALSLVTIGLGLAMFYRSRNLRTLKAAEAKTREADERARIMLDATPLACALTNRNYDCLDCNKEALKLFGVATKREYIEHFFEFWPEFQPDGEKSRDKAFRLFQKAFDEGYAHFEWENLIKGERVPCELTLVRVKYGDDDAIARYTRDLRAIKAAEAKTREADERAKIIFDTAPLASCMFDRDGNILDCNQEIVTMFGIPDKEFFLANFFTVLFPEYQPGGELSAEVAAENGRVAVEKGYHHFECLHRKLSGEPLPSEVTMVRVRYRGEYAVAGYFRDLTAQKAMVQLAKQQAEAESANRAKSSFLATMSHEIRTPMNAISGMAELLLRRKNLPDEARAEARDIKQAASNLISIINDILDLSKIEAGKMEIIPAKYLLLSLVNDTVNIIRMRLMEKPIRLYTNIDAKIPYLLIGDEVRLRQILLNLLSNAAKYTDKGHISLSIAGQKRESGRVWLEMTVADTGKGIKPEDQEKIFGSFVRLDAKKNRGIMGTGLGLAITRELCQAMEGTVTFQSEYGRGSEFKVVIPQGVSSEEPFAMVTEPEKKRVLVYEGRAVWARTICWSLENLGVPFVMTETLDAFAEALPREEWYYVFSGYGLYSRIKPLLEQTVFPGGKKPPLALMVEWENEAHVPGVRFVSLPIQSLSIANVLNDKDDDRSYFSTQSSTLLRYTYPHARLLVVDDIGTNLKVAEGLLAPYQAKVDTSQSGALAVELVKQHEYDIVFMDHMMPDMDGLEATAAIRAWEEVEEELEGGPAIRAGEGESWAADRRAHVPIIALTANAVSGMREMFIEKGFDDFLAKPIDISKLDEMLDHWIPKEKRGERPGTGEPGENMAEGGRERVADQADLPQIPGPDIPGIDMRRGLALTGGTMALYGQAHRHIQAR
jgi:PAS domain S-box-containing protein